MTKSLKNMSRNQSTLWHLQRLQLDLQQHVADMRLPKTVRPHLEQASQSIASARIALEAKSKS